MIDGPLKMLPGGTYWYATSYVCTGEIRHTQLKGSLDNPYASAIWMKKTCNRNASGYCINEVDKGTNFFTSFNPSLNDVVALWLVGVYSVGGSEYIGIVHEELVGHSSPGSGKTRIGLAWSNDSGNTWKYLGRIISQLEDPIGNIQGAPYMIKDGYMYVYFHDEKSGAGVAVARANLGNVISSARAGHVGTNLWKKYFQGIWSEPGMGGRSDSLGIQGISHSQIVWSNLTKRYYFATSRMSWNQQNTFVKLYESVDGVNWKFSKTIVEEPASQQGLDGGYQYCTVVSDNASANHIANGSFYVYCAKFKTSATNICSSQRNSQALHRWKITVQ
ncbi:MAG: hypothetical protein IPN70_01275 [Candidatus Moraniibacteriota bacterium]|nr:MAG: hypothetical protein IPN70_01275 [Candidatus Moranbacteria bacterium]